MRIEPLDGAAVTVRVLHDPAARTPEQAAAIDRAWRGLCARNPRYFNGRILSFESYDAGVVVARVDEYRSHAARGTVDLGVSFFGVTGVVRVRDGNGRGEDRGGGGDGGDGGDGRSRFLLTRRGDGVHDYPGLWEFGPCGGVEPPEPAQDRLGHAGLAGELAREALEELGLDLAGVVPRPLALVHDDLAGSTDVMMLVDLPEAVAVAGRGWEVSAARWATLNEVAEEADGVSPPTRAMARWLRGRRDFNAKGAEGR